MSALRATVSAFAQSREDGVASSVVLDNSTDPAGLVLGAGDVLVEVKSAAVTYIDLLMLSGQYHHKPPLPYTPGIEYAGVVHAVGSAVTTWRPGDRVSNDFMRTGPRSTGGHQRWGGWARFAVAPADTLMRVPESMSFDMACNLLLNYETAVFAFNERVRLTAGETVLVTGATGAAGLAAVQVAKLLGAGTVIATGRGQERLATARQMGANHTIDLLSLPQPREKALRDALHALTGRGADVLFDPVGGEWLVPSLRALDFGGRMAIIGWAANTGVAHGAGAGGSVSPDQLPTNLVQLKGLTVMGSPLAVMSQRNPQGRARRLEQIAGWMQQGVLTPVVTRSFALTEIHAAMQARLAGVVGGCVVRP